MGKNSAEIHSYPHKDTERERETHTDTDRHKVARTGAETDSAEISFFSDSYKCVRACVHINLSAGRFGGDKLLVRLEQLRLQHLHTRPATCQIIRVTYQRVMSLMHTYMSHVSYIYMYESCVLNIHQKSYIPNGPTPCEEAY